MAKRHRTVGEIFAAAEDRLQRQSAEDDALARELDPEGVEVAGLNLRHMVEDADEEIQERQLNQAMLAERRQQEQHVRQARINRRQDYYEQRRRGLRRVMERQLGHAVPLDDFIIEVSKMGRQDMNWSDDE